ncbi:MAG: MBOAT family protein [Firmicutes bacterium]|nr:MBOAT family protein [Bacillota bacterium]
MLFSSISFLYFFLPILLLIYFISPMKWKNLVLLFFSMLFYFLGEPKYIIVLILSGTLNYMFSKIIAKNIYRRTFLVLAVLYNVIQLLIFKYTDFFISNLNGIFNTNISFLYIVMPIGISFFTFQALGYVIDVYNKKHEPAKNIWEFMTYLCLFPQLIAGPIVRYSDVQKELKERKMNFRLFSEGISRFVIGLSKKVLLANVLGEFAKECIEKTIMAAWLRPIAYTLQIYFDFSGYSDMAIGLGLMFGFRFLENFNYPLIANSITDFWRRWHISLSTWFKDYVYIPLGGNRVKKVKWIRNLFVVWFLTGFWHGASWNFIIWGLYFGILLILEKELLKKWLDKTKVIKYFYTLVIVVISFMIFNSLTVGEIINNFKDMFFISNIPLTGNVTLYYLRSYLVIFIIAFVAATPLFSWLIKKIKKTKAGVLIDAFEPFYYIVLLTLCTAYLIDASFNPFLYFRF